MLKFQSKRKTTTTASIFFLVFEQSKKDDSAVTLSCQNIKRTCDSILNKVMNWTVETIWFMMINVALYCWLVLQERRTMIINKNIIFSDYVIFHFLFCLQTQQTFITHCEHSAHSSYCHSQSEADFSFSILYYCCFFCCY